MQFGYIKSSELIEKWFALCIEAQGVKEGIKIAVFMPLMIISMIAAFVYVGYSFTVVFG